MKPGSSEIFVYNYEGRAPETDIGRVYVEDPDDWDLPDKTFDFKEPYKWRDLFRLDRQTGVIKMKKINFRESTDIMNYNIEFLVEDRVHNQINENAVPAMVNVTIKRISKEAVFKSGSMRIRGNAEDFVRQDADGYSKRDRYGFSMKRKLNATHFDVFTVLPSSDGEFTGKVYTLIVSFITGKCNLFKDMFVFFIMINLIYRYTLCCSWLAVLCSRKNGRNSS